MSLLDSIVGMVTGQQNAAGGGNLLGAVVGMLAPAGQGGQGGGLPELMAKFQNGGLGDVIGSWVSSGKNLPISAEQLQSVLGSDTIANLARQFGLSTGDAAGQLSQLLPQVVDTLTPQGEVPAQGLGNMSDMLGQLSHLMPR